MCVGNDQRPAAVSPLGATSGTIFDGFQKPACAELLGWTLLAHDAAKGWAKIAFEGLPAFLNPAGFVQGGLLTAMLDDSMGPALLLMTEGKSYSVTIDMHVSFLAPARPGRLAVAPDPGRVAPRQGRRRGRRRAGEYCACY